MVRNKSRFNIRWAFMVFLIALAVLLIAVAGFAVTHMVMQARQKAWEKQLAAGHLALYPRLTAEQLAVYGAVLSIAYKGDSSCNKKGECMRFSILYGEGGVNLSDQTSAINGFDAQNCLKKLGIEDNPSSEVHHFREEDVALLGSFKLRLVDPDQRMKWIHENNPDDARREGRTVKPVVDDGFERGLTTLSEIQFDKSHTHALVSISYVCGALCGDGATFLMEKKGDTWIQKNECDSWIS